MGKRRRNERMTLPGAAGVSKIRYCPDHNNPVKAVRIWPKKRMMWECTDGCKLDVTCTILKVPEGPSRRR